MAELPYMQFFPADYLRDTEILSLSAQGGWMRMLCSMWHPTRRGVLSLRLQAMARLLHASEPTTKSIIREIEECGVADVVWGGHSQANSPDDEAIITITCRRIVRDWQKAEGGKKTLSDAGKRGAAKRWGNREPNREANDHPISPPYGNPEARSHIDRERESAGAGTRRPTLGQAKAAASEIGISAEKADEWWHAREANDWLKGTAGGGTTPVGTNWRADMKTYASRGSAEPRKPSHRAEKAAAEYPEPQVRLPRL